MFWRTFWASFTFEPPGSSACCALCCVHRGVCAGERGDGNAACPRDPVRNAVRDAHVNSLNEMDYRIRDWDAARSEYLCSVPVVNSPLLFVPKNETGLGFPGWATALS